MHAVEIGSEDFLRYLNWMRANGASPTRFGVLAHPNGSITEFREFPCCNSNVCCELFCLHCATIFLLHGLANCPELAPEGAAKLS